MGILYKLTFSSGRSYVGITTLPIKKRLAGHKSAARICAKGKKNQTPLYRAWNKYGDPIVEILSTCRNKALLRNKEVRAIAAHKTLNPLGYNTTPGGDFSPMWLPEIAAKMIGRRHGEEARKKMRGRVWPKEAREAVARARRGKKLSFEHKRKIAIACLGRKPTETTLKKLRGRIWTKAARKRLSEKLKGRIVTPEARAKISAANKGRRLTDEQKEHLRKITTGIRRSPGMRAKIAAANRLRVMKDETRRKHSENAKLYWAKRKGEISND